MSGFAILYPKLECILLLREIPQSASSSMWMKAVVSFALSISRLYLLTRRDFKGERSSWTKKYWGKRGSKVLTFHCLINHIFALSQSFLISCLFWLLCKHYRGLNSALSEKDASAALTQKGKKEPKRPISLCYSIHWKFKVVRSLALFQIT